MTRFRLLIWCAFLIAAFCLAGCGADSGDEGDDRMGAVEDGNDSDDETSDDASPEPDFVLTGGIYRSSPNDDFVELRLADVPDNPDDLELDQEENADVQLGSLFDGIDENSFLVMEDGVPRQATIGPATKDSKAKGVGRVVILYDWTDSMRDEHRYAIQSVRNLLDALALSYAPLYVYVHCFKDYDSAWRRVGWWQWYNVGVLNYLNAYAYDTVDGGFGGNRTIAENPLRAIMWEWPGNAYISGQQTIFILVTDASMHQTGDADTFDWPYTSGYYTTQVTSALTSASYNPKGVVYVASPYRTTGHYSNTWAYWDNRCYCWTTDEHRGHDSPWSLADQTGGAWYHLGALPWGTQPGQFYGSKGGGTVEKGLTVTYESVDAAAKHDVVVTVALEDGRWGEIVFENINYIEPIDPNAYEEPEFDVLDGEPLFPSPDDTE